MENIDKFFPAVHECSRKVGDQVLVESRELFGDLVGVLEVLFNETVGQNKDKVPCDVVITAL